MKQSITEVRHEKTIRQQIDFLKKIKANYEIHNSNYTTTVKVLNTGAEIKYVSSLMSKRTFYAYSKIKSDVIKNNFLKTVQGEKITNNKEIHFENHEYISPFHADEVINIDIKSAYPTTIYQQGGISTETYNYLNNLKKSEKLASLGMLASQKEITTYIRGKATGIRLKRNPLSEVFFYCVKTIDFFMMEIKKIAHEYFIYFWVDGVYLRPDTPLYILDEITQLLLCFGYELHMDIIKDFNLSRTKDSIIVNFLKLEKNKKGVLIDTRKNFKFPDKAMIKKINTIITYFRTSKNDILNNI